MPMPPRRHIHGQYYEKPPHEDILERLDRIEEVLRRIEEKG